jgi:diamine N-acetyltransferase
MTITLKPVTPQNREAVCALQVHEHQRNLIATNSESMRNADISPTAVPKAIYRENELVGFLLYQPRGNDVFSLHRMMIDANHQRQGIGRGAIKLAIQEMEQLGATTIYLSFRPENDAAGALYELVGFTYQETEEDGEILYRRGPEPRGDI